MKTNRLAIVVSAASAVVFVASAAVAQVTWSSAKHSGEASPRPWPGQWWGHRSNGTAIYKGVPGGYGSGYNDPVSPVEKLDKALGRGAKVETAKLGTWLTCALKAWEPCRSKSGTARNDCVGKSEYQTAYQACSKGFTTDTAQEWETVNHGVGSYGWDTWWGHCNAWAAVAILYKEPTKTVAWNGLNFDVGDIKGLLTEVGMDTDLTADGWNCSRYDGDESAAGADTGSAYNDCTPGQYLRAFGKYLGSLKQGVVIDRYTGGEVWNQPAASFTGSCTAASSGCPAGETANNCSTTMEWAEDGVDFDATTAMAGASGYSKRTLSYRACVKNDQLTSNSKWNPGSLPKADRWPDFIWIPSKFSSAADSANPYVFDARQQIVDSLVKKSNGDSGGGGTPTQRLIKEYKKTVNKAIPDNNTTGVSSFVTSSSTVTKVVNVELCVNATHTYRGDLEVSLTSPNGKTALVWDNQGGATDNIKECLAVPGVTGGKAKGKWTVKVVDNGSGDTGNLVDYSVKLYK